MFILFLFFAVCLHDRRLVYHDAPPSSLEATAPLGMKEMTESIELLLLSFSMATDVLSVPLLKQEVKTIWAEQRTHESCIQDPPRVELYTVTGHIKKGSVVLPGPQVNSRISIA